MVKIVATQNMPYGKHRYAAGEEIEVSEKDARLLVKIGRAAHIHPSRAAPAALDMARPAAAPTLQEAAQDAPLSPQYTRRDMTAERPGQTGPAQQSPSSRRGRRPRAST